MKRAEKSTSLHLPALSDTLAMDDQSNAIATENTNRQSDGEALVYRVEDIARMLAISQRAAYNLCNRTQEFRVLHIGGSIRISKMSFDRWMACTE